MKLNKKNRKNFQNLLFFIFVIFVLTFIVTLILDSIKHSNNQTNLGDDQTITSGIAGLSQKLHSMNPYKYPMPGPYNPHPPIMVPFLHSAATNWQVPPSYPPPTKFSHIFYMAPANPPPFSPMDETISNKSEIIEGFKYPNNNSYRGQTGDWSRRSYSNRSIDSLI
jgi:hypothetical protein